MLRSIPRTVWILGFVSLFMDASSELVHSLLPVFLVTTLGASALTVGLIEGVAEAVPPLIKVFSGAVSDIIRRRKALILSGYGLATLSKPFFPLAQSAEGVFFARCVDRIGKGIRGAPRDALVADVAPAEMRGACFGLRQSMDTIGAVLGPAFAILLMMWLANDIRRVLWFAVAPAVVAVVLIVVGVRDPKPKIGGEGHHGSPIRRAALRQFSAGYWRIVVIGAFFTLARFSEAFLILRARSTGLVVTWVPLVMIVMSVTYALSAFPVGIVSDRMGRRWLLAVGLLLLILADVILAWAGGPLAVLLGVALWGLHLGFTQGVLSAMVADATPPNLKGTAFGLFNLATAVFLLMASFIAGGVWDRYGAAATFVVGAFLSLVALVFLMSFGQLPGDRRPAAGEAG